jgi:hypothetical protein
MNIDEKILTGRYLAVYFVFADMILFAQYLWYRRTRRMQMKQQKSGLSFLQVPRENH